MTREQYQSLKVSDLRELAKRRGVRRTSMLKKTELIDAMLEMDTADAGGRPTEAAEAETQNAAGTEAQNAAETEARNAAEAEAQNRTRELLAQEAKKSLEENPGTESRTEEHSGAEEENREEKSPEIKTEGRPEEGIKTESRVASEKASEKSTENVRKRDNNDRRDNSQERRGRQMRGPAQRAKGHESTKTDKTRSDRQTSEKQRTNRPAAEKQRADRGTVERSKTDRGAAERQKPDRSASERQRPERLKPDRQFTEKQKPDRGTAEKNRAETQKEEENSRLQETETVREQKTSSMPEGHDVRGVLEVMQDGFGFLRSDNFLSGPDDVYVSPSQIRRFGLKTGDMITGKKRLKAANEKFDALLFVSQINDRPNEEARRRTAFEKMTPIFPNERIRLERPDGSVATRVVDLISPIGKGQRGMIVSPPKAGKTTLLKDIAKSILTQNPDANLIILLIDERPEEVTDMRESVTGKHVDVIYSTFDELPEHHRRVSEMVIERAKRLVEQHEDVIILLDSITRLTRAYNILVPQSGRTLSGGLDPTALYMPKRFFGAARNMREGGSLTILATALVDTGSKMDDVVYEEFKGTGNMELILDRKLQERRIFPAIDIIKSGTRREDLLLTPRELKAAEIIHRRMSGLKAEEAVEQILNAFAYYKTNEQVVDVILQKWGA